MGSGGNSDTAGKPVKNGYIFLLECLIAVAIIMSMVTLAAPIYQKQQKEFVINAYARQLAMHLQVVRTYDFTAPKDKTANIVFQENSYTVRGAGPQWDGSYPCPEGIYIKWKRRNKISFSLHGRGSGTETFYICNKDSTYNMRVVVASQTGRIRLE